MAWALKLRAGLSEPAYGLAVLRIAVVAMVLVSPELRAAKALARTPELLLASPEGLGLLAHVSIPQRWLSVVEVLALSFGAMALLGYWSRLSCAVLTLATTLLWSFPERAGATLPGLHLLWLLALLSVSRSGDVWSLDSWGHKRPPAPSLRYGAPLCFARVLLGCVYFFPGLHQLKSAGGPWTSAENVTNVLYAKWFQQGRLPPLRIDEQPQLLAWGGALLLAFELSFWLLALLPRTRLLALLLGLGFHAVVQLFLFLRFPSLWVCYVVLVPWQRAFTRWTWSLPGGARFNLPWPSIVVGSALVLAVAFAGARGQTNAYPFACYPTFAGRFERSAPDLVVDVVDSEGARLRLERDLRGYRTQQQWGQIYWLLGAYGRAPSDEQLLQFARRAATSPRARAALQQASKLRFLAAQYGTTPADWGKPPLATRLIRELVVRRPASLSSLPRR